MKPTYKYPTKPVPPKVRRAAGRPKKNRRKDGNEEPVGGSQMKRTYNDTQCALLQKWAYIALFFGFR